MRLNLVRLKSVPPTASQPGQAILRIERKGFVDQIKVPIKIGSTLIKTAIQYLEDNNFIVVGYGHYTTIPYILTSTFKPLVSEIE